MRRVSVYALSLAALLSLPAESIGSARDPLIWEDQFDLAGQNDQAFGITVSNRTAVAIGVGGTASGGVDLLDARAYDVRTGTLEWQDQRPLASGFITTVVIDDVARKVFGAGYAANGPGTDFLVRAYDARTGDWLWEDVVDKGRDDFVQDIAAGQEGVFVVGYGGNTGGSAVGLLVRAYHKRTGNLLWEDQVDHGGQEAAAWQVETEGGLVPVAGSIRDGPDEQEMMLRAYDARTGHACVAQPLPDGIADRSRGGRRSAFTWAVERSVVEAPPVRSSLPTTSTPAFCFGKRQRATSFEIWLSVDRNSLPRAGERVCCARMMWRRVC